jgi:alkylation response protein AidB-like acyl-CoA dehydrogenase
MNLDRITTMDFELPPDTLMLRDMLRRFIQKEARPLEMKYFNAGSLTVEERARLRKAIEQLGLWGLMAPEEYGGGGLDTVTACVIEEELGSTFVPVEMGNVPAILFACREHQVSQFLEPALAGARRPLIAAREPGRGGLQPDQWSTTAVLEGEGFRINGRKLLSIPPEPDDFLILFTRTRNGTDTKGLTAFILEANTPGLHTTAGVEVLTSLENCFAGQGQLLGEPGGALALLSKEAPRSWIQTGARYVGIAGRLIEMATDYARDWVSLGAPLAARPAIQRLLAEISVDVESARWLVYHAAWLVDSGKNEKIQCAAAQVRLATCVMLQRAIDTLTVVFAGPGPSQPIEPGRLVHSAIPAEALELAIERTRAIIAADMLGLPRVGSSV